MKEYEIDVKLKVFVTDNRYEPTGEFRKVLKGERYVVPESTPQDIFVWSNDLPSSGKYAILREKFELPDWIPDGYWVTRDRNGHVRMFRDEPGHDDFGWCSVDSGGDHISMLMNAHGIELPKLPPEQSKWQKKPKEKQ